MTPAPHIIQLAIFPQQTQFFGPYLVCLTTNTISNLTFPQSCFPFPSSARFKMVSFYFCSRIVDGFRSLLHSHISHISNFWTAQLAHLCFPPQDKMKSVCGYRNHSVLRHGFADPQPVSLIERYNGTDKVFSIGLGLGFCLLKITNCFVLWWDWPISHLIISLVPLEAKV